MMLQLADRTMRYPYGFLEDILMKAIDLVIPANFYVLDMPNEQGGDGTLILGRPFLRTANTNIDMQNGSITMSLDYTHPTPSNSTITNNTLRKSSTNPLELEKGLVFYVNASVSKAAKTSKKKKCFNLFRELRALNVVHGPVITPVALHSTVSTPSTKKANQETVVTPTDSKKVDSEKESKKPTSLKLCSKAKKKIKTPSATFPPLSIDHYTVIDLVYEDPFLLTPEEAVKIKSGAEVWAMLSTYQTPKAEKRAKWIGPFEVQSTCQHRKVVMRDAEGQFFQVKKERLRFFKESYQPP
ncbi:uncharacterized protein LOC114719874 [Neltuma alba]|uniref:uncharacterized protein LOC114719874 n=1 Tax=Neltuma alba TaxID=207710 RepID=UPI0010A4429F|nr:uncharacterized protein LOC114719874 [Prosopis alba]